jgi:hypothetical protein
MPDLGLDMTNRRGNGRNRCKTNAGCGKKYFERHVSRELQKMEIWLQLYLMVTVRILRIEQLS